MCSQVVVASLVVLVALGGCGTSGMDAPVTHSDGGSETMDGPVVESTSCAGMAPQPRDATWRVADRDVRVHVPASYDPSSPMPVVLDLHGMSFDGASHARITHLIDVADAHGFIAVHPDGTGSPRSWNAGDCCNRNGPDEVAFVTSVLDELEARLCVDTRRVYTLGMSNGGFLSHMLGCRLADRIAAIGAVAGVLGIDDCNPSRPVPVFHVHGTSDNLIPYNGGGINGSKSVAATIDFWADRNGCATTPMQTFANGDATCMRRASCTDGADVELCTIEGGGHQWPGGESIGSFHGKLSNDLVATEAAWAFFAAHPRPM